MSSANKALYMLTVHWNKTCLNYFSLNTKKLSRALQINTYAKTYLNNYFSYIMYK